MSVVKSKRGKSDLEIINKAKGLAVYTIKICGNEKNFPNLILSMNRFYENLWKEGK